MHPFDVSLAPRDRRRPRSPADTARRSSRGGPLRAGLRRATKRAARARSRSASPHPRTTWARPADRARGVAFSGCRRDGPRSSAARIAPAVGAVAATAAAEPPEAGTRAHADASFPSSTARAAPRATARRLPVPGAAVSANTAVPAEAAATTATTAAATTTSAASTAADAPDASAGTAPDDDGYGDDQARLGLRRLESRAHGPAGQRQRQGIAVLSGTRT
jgi:hypothetical protein